MKKVLIASPVRGGMSPTFVKNIMAIMMSKINAITGGPNAPYRCESAWTSGTSVAMARDELANVAIKGGFDKLVMIDIDLGCTDSTQTVSMFARLLSHDVPVVAGQYVGHNFNSSFHGAVADGVTGPRPDGLMEMAQIPLGFSCIDVKDALLKIKAHHPHRRYAIRQTLDVITKPDMFEFFPNGLVGPCSIEGKFERIKELWAANSLPPTDENMVNDQLFLEGVKRIMADTNYDSTFMLGEDYYFCKLAREAGVKLYIDNNIIVPHESHVRIPVPNSKVLTALTEPWRWADSAKPEEISETVKVLQKMMGPDHV